MHEYIRDRTVESRELTFSSARAYSRSYPCILCEAKGNISDEMRKNRILFFSFH